VLGLEFDDDACWFWFVRRHAGQSLVAPIRKIYDFRCPHSIPGNLVGRLQNVQPIAIEQKSVMPKQFVQLRNRWVIVGKGLDPELVDGSLDLCGSQFHRSFLSIVFFMLQRGARRVTRRMPFHLQGGQRWPIFLVADPRRRIFERAANPVTGYTGRRAERGHSIAAYRPQYQGYIDPRF
jgi:hypothetical protein